MTEYLSIPDFSLFSLLHSLSTPLNWMHCFVTELPAFLKILIHSQNCYSCIKENINLPSLTILDFSGAWLPADAESSFPSLGKKEKDLGKKEKGEGREEKREEEREEEGEGGKGGEEEREKCVWRNRQAVLLERIMMHREKYSNEIERDV